MRLIAILIGLLSFTRAASAAPTCADLKKLWNEYYYADFGVTWAKDTKFDCPGGEGKLAEAIYHLHNPVLQKESPTDKEPPRFYRYAKTRIESTRYEKACKVFAYARDGELTLCPAFFEKSAEYRASTLIHEARHLTEGDPNHVQCTRSQYVVCDAKLANNAKGSGFNYDLAYLTWILYGASHHELSKWVLQSEINALVPDRFNEVFEEDIKKWRIEPTR